MAIIKHECDGCRPLYSDENLIMKNGEEYSARIFAERMARKEFGRRGIVGTLRLNSWNREGTLEEWDAFIGTKSEYGGISGHNVMFSVVNSVVKKQ